MLTDVIMDRHDQRRAQAGQMTATDRSQHQIDFTHTTLGRSTDGSSNASIAKCV